MKTYDNAVQKVKVWDVSNQLILGVTTTRTPCMFGGSRLWFVCPVCARRVAVFHVVKGGFQCRNCSGVAYYSKSIYRSGARYQFKRALHLSEKAQKLSKEIRRIAWRGKPTHKVERVNKYLEKSWVAARAFNVDIHKKVI